MHCTLWKMSFNDTGCITTTPIKSARESKPLKGYCDIAFSGRTGVKWSYLLNLPYIVLPLIGVFKFIRERPLQARSFRRVSFHWWTGCSDLDWPCSGPPVWGIWLELQFRYSCIPIPSFLCFSEHECPNLIGLSFGLMLIAEFHVNVSFFNIKHIYMT